MQHIAFIGLGNMGGPMALNLVRAGYRLWVFALVPRGDQPVVEGGAPAPATAAEAVREADVVVSMLPASQHVKTLYLAAGGVLDTARAGTLLIDSSTIASQAAIEVATAAKARGFTMLDAPVSGGTAGAAAGTLTFIVGGEDDTLTQARPILEKMGKNIFHAGGNGAGQTAKICNNMLLGILMAGTSEAIALGVANGLDPKVLSEIMSKSSGRNWALELYNPWPGVMDGTPASREYSGGFGTDLMLKDLGLAEETAMAARAATPLGSVTRQLYQLHSQAGQGRLDFSSIVQMVKKPV